MGNNKSEATPLLTALHHLLMCLSKPATDEEGNCNPDAVIRALQHHGWKIDLQQQVGGADVVILAVITTS